MRILISGGTGFIGKALVNNLTQGDHQISILSRNPEKHQAMYNHSIRFIKWDGNSTNNWGEIIEKTDAVINLAGENIAGNSFISIFFKRFTPDRKRTLLESRINATNALVQAINNASHKPSVFIQASAVGYYGDREDEFLYETASPGNDFAAQLCKQWEEGLLKLKTSHIRQVILRTAGVVMGKTGGAFPFLLLPYRLFMGGPLGDGKQWMSWIHIDDEIKAIRFLLETDHAQGVFNVCSPNPVTNIEFGKTIAKIIHRPFWLPIPKFAFNFILGEKAKILLASQRQIPDKLMQLNFEFSYPVLSKALHYLL